MASISPDFRQYLHEELIRRCKSDPRYSLRAFARALELEPSALSKILRGKRGLSINMFRNLVSRLGLSPDRVAHYEKTLGGANGDLFQQQEIVEKSFEAYQVLADWYHLAILELIGTVGFKQDSKWLSSKLGVSVVEVDAALGRMKKLGLMAVDDSGKWLNKIQETNVFNSDLGDSAMRSFQKQVLEKAIRALDDVPLEKRFGFATTISVDSRKFSEIKLRLREIKAIVTSACEASSDKDTIYHLTLNFCPALRTGNAIQSEAKESKLEEAVSLEMMEIPSILSSADLAL